MQFMSLLISTSVFLADIYASAPPTAVCVLIVPPIATLVGFFVLLDFNLFCLVNEFINDSLALTASLWSS